MRSIAEMVDAAKRNQRAFGEGLSIRHTRDDGYDVFEFNVKIYGLNFKTCATQDQWDIEAQDALDAFTERVQRKYPFIRDVHFAGRSGGWLAVTDPEGRMTPAKLAAISKMAKKALDAFKTRIKTEYPCP